MRLITALLGVLLLPQILIAQGGLTGVIPTDPSVNRTNWAHNVYGTTISGASNSGILIDGIRNGVGTIVTTSVSAGGALTIDLGAVRTISRAQLRLWDGDNRYYRYKLESSQDNVTYEMLVDRTTGEHQSVQHVEFSPVAARYVKLTGTFVSTGNDFRLVDEVILSGESNVTPHAEEVLSIGAVANFSEATGVQRTLHAGIYEVSFESGAGSKYANDSANGGKTWSIELTAKAKLFGHQYDFGFPASKIADFATAAQAAAYGQGKKFTVYLPYESAVSFYYPDAGPGDNRGGVQYRIRQLSGPNDSLLARVRDALTRSTLWEERAVAGWGSWLNTGNNYCFGCHIQSQASVGLNDSKQKLPDLPVNLELESELVDAYETWQNPGGWVLAGSTSFIQTETSLWAWAVASYGGSWSQQLTDNLVNAMNWLLTQQTASGGWNADHTDGNGARLYFDGAPSAAHTSGNIAALVTLMDRLPGGFSPFSGASISGGQVEFQSNPGYRVDLQVAPVQDVTAVRITIEESFDGGANFVLNEIDLYNGATSHVITSATASAQQTGYPITESYNGIRTNINDGWAVSPQLLTVAPAVGEWRISAADIDRISLTQIYPDHQLKKYRVEYTTDPTPSSTSVFTPFTISQVGISQPIAVYQTALLNAAGLLMSPGWSFARNVRTAAQTIIGLYSALPYLSSTAATQAVTRLQEIGIQLRAAQRADGGWSDAMNASGTSAPYYTAMALKALSLIADSTLDDALTKGADFLLETQSAAGPWTQSNIGTALAPTTWVEIALPAIFDVLNQQYQRDVITDLTAEGFVNENRLYWSPIAGATGYDVYRKVEGGPFELVASGYVNGIVTYLDTNVTNEVTYYYMVKWLDNEGRESAESNEASATPYGLQCGADTPPVIRSGPPVSAVPDEGYVYQIDATDADPNDTLSFSLTAAPSGMVINQSSGQITWTPTQQQVGSHFVKVRVSDRIGRFATQAYRINVSEVYFNREPAFYSTPLETAYQGNPYQYVARASDPNVGDMLTYALMEKPVGAGINPTTGRISWTPSAGQMSAPQFFRVRVTDTGGLFDEQTFNVTVAGNTAPVITSTPDPIVYTGQVYYYDVNATDTEGGPLLYTLAQAPIGMFINPSTGEVIWTSGGVGAALVRVRVSDPAFAVTEQPFTVDVIDNLAPIITSVPPAQGVVGVPYQYQITATDPEANPISYALVSGPAGMTISGRTVSYVPSVEGPQSVTVSASDAGQTTEQGFTIQVLAAGSIVPPGPGGIGGSPDLPQVTLNSPDTLQPIETLTPVVLTITDPLPGGAPLSWEVELAREGGGAPIVIGSGSGEISQQAVGVIDPSVLESDPYRITVRVTKGATSVSPWWGVNVISRLKFGEFSLGATDFSIPLSGVSIDIRRQYRSFDLLKYDFGFGWRLGTAGRVVDSASESPRTPYGSNTKVYVTKPDGKRVGFRFQAVGVPLFGFKLPSFVPDPGVTDTLETEQIPIIVTPNGFYEMFGGEYNPSRFVLTTKERIRYTIDEVEGLIEVRDANSNRLEFSAGGIQHSGGISVSFTRDSAGRITRVTDGAGGHYDYAYNPNGELERFTKPSGEHVDFTYDTAHRLLTITDNAGIVILRNEYDSAGRLIRQFDANNNVVQISNDPVNLRETVVDRRGNSTTYQFDPDGNPIQVTDAVGGVTTMTYDSNFNLTTLVDPAGHTRSYMFDGSSNMLSSTDELGRITAYSYNANGQVVSLTKPSGAALTFQYDSFGNLRSLTDASGRVSALEYDSRGNITRSRDALGNETLFSHDGFGRVITATKPMGESVSYTYDSSGRRLTSTVSRVDNDGIPHIVLTRYEYDSQGRVFRVTDPENYQATVQWNQYNKLDWFTDKNGNTLNFEYDGRGLLTKIRWPDLTERTITYDAEGNKVSETDRRGFTTSYAYDSLNRLITITHPNLSQTLRVYDAVDNLVSETDGLGRVTTYDHDAAGRTTSVTNAIGGVIQTAYDVDGHVSQVMDQLGRITIFENDSDGRLLRTIRPDGSIQFNTYDGVGRLIETTDSLGNSERVAYDASGRVSRKYDAKSSFVEYLYDSVGNKVREIDELGEVTRYDYNNRGELIRTRKNLGFDERRAYDGNGNTVQKIDAAGRTWLYAFNSNNFNTTTTAPGNSVTTFEYNPLGLKTKVIDPLGNQYRFTYDNMGRLVQEQDPLNALTVKTYDLVGNLVSIVDRNGKEKRWEYDNLNRIINEKWFDGATLVRTKSYTLDAVGNTLTEEDVNGRYTYQYDSRGRPTQVALTGVVGVPNTTFSSLFDTENNPRQIADSMGNVLGLEYDDNYELESQEWDDSIGVPNRFEYSRDLRHGLVGISWFDQLVGGTPLSSTTILRDSLGRESSSVTRNSGGAPVFSSSYVHSPVGELATQTHNGQVSSYTYSSRGELLTASLTGQSTETFVFDLNGNRSSSGYVIGAGNRVVSDPQYDYSHDNAGNIIIRTLRSTGEIERFTYDHDNRIVVAEGRSASNVLLYRAEFDYDVKGRRVRQNLNGQIIGTLFNEENVWADFNSSGQQVAGYLTTLGIDDIVAKRNPDGSVERYIKDSIGSIRGRIDSSSNLINQVSYKAFGGVAAQSGSGDRFKFAGREVDGLTGLYFNRARYYDPSVGRFTSEDPLGFEAGDSNLYRYTGNSPINFTDPSGLLAEYTNLVSRVSVPIAASVAQGTLERQLVISSLRTVVTTSEVAIGVGEGVIGEYLRIWAIDQARRLAITRAINVTFAFLGATLLEFGIVQETGDEWEGKVEVDLGNGVRLGKEFKNRRNDCDPKNPQPIRPKIQKFEQHSQPRCWDATKSCFWSVGQGIGLTLAAWSRGRLMPPSSKGIRKVLCFPNSQPVGFDQRYGKPRKLLNCVLAVVAADCSYHGYPVGSFYTDDD